MKCCLVKQDKYGRLSHEALLMPYIDGWRERKQKRQIIPKKLQELLSEACACSNCCESELVCLFDDNIFCSSFGGTSLSTSFMDYEPQKLTEFLQEFAVTTSAHGIPRVGQAKSITGRIVWAIVFLLCFGMFSYQVYWVIEKYLRNEKIVNIGPPDNSSTCICIYDRMQDTAWPCHAMSKWTTEQCSLCSSNGYCVPPWSIGIEVLRRNLTTTPCVCQNLTNICLKVTEGSPFMHLWDFMTTSAPATPPPTTTEDPQLIDALGFEGMTDEVAIVTRAKENLVFSMANLPKWQRIALSYQKDEVIKKCSFNGIQCDIHKDFKLHVDPVYGNCYVFNHHRHIMKRSSRAGPMYGLRVFMYINTSDFLTTSENKGVRIAIHNQTEMPFPDAYGFSAPTGFTSSFGIKMKLMNRLPKPYGDCVKEGRVEDYIYPDYDYSPEGCYRTCFQRQLTGRCGCGDPRFPALPGYTICAVDNSASRACLEEMVNNGGLNSVKECDCGNPCDQAVFSVSFSASKWPSGSSKPADCPIEMTKDECIKTYQDNAAMVEIYFEQLNYETLRESEAYGIVNLMADFGGQLGLWMGISVITCAEFFVLIWDMTKFCVLNLRNRERKADARKLREKRQEELRLEEQMEINGNKNSKYFVEPDSAYTYNEVKQFNL